MAKKDNNFGSVPIKSDVDVPVVTSNVRDGADNSYDTQLSKKLKDIMENLVELTDDDADMLKLGLAQNICYLCGKEFKYRIQLKKHLSKFHNHANKHTNITETTTDNLKDDNINIANETKHGIDKYIFTARSSTAAERREATVNEISSGNIDVAIDTDDHIPVSDSRGVGIREKGFPTNKFVGNFNNSIVTYGDDEALMKFEDATQIPHEVSGLSNSTATFTETVNLPSDTIKEDEVEEIIVIGKHDNKYIRPKTDPNRLKYDCEQCDQRFEFPYQLKRHTNIVHEGKYPYSCDICGKEFDRIGTMKAHKLVHTDERPYKCEQCDTSFKMKGSLRKHMLIHSSEKIFKCEHCTSRFMFREQLISHLVIHTGEKQFSCVVCGKAFARKAYVKEHMMIHTEEKKYPCTMCDKVFLRPYSRKVHMRNHMENKPHQCAVCPASFSQRCSLLQHVRLHTGERPFNCNYCPRNFVQQSALTAHLVTHCKVVKKSKSVSVNTNSTHETEGTTQGEDKTRQNE